MTASLHCRLPQQVNATFSARSVTEELGYLAKQGAAYAAQGVAHVQRVGIIQVCPRLTCFTRSSVWNQPQPTVWTPHPGQRTVALKL